MTPTLEHDDRGWWVRCLDGTGREVRVGPFTGKGAAWSFALRVGGMR